MKRRGKALKRRYGRSSLGASFLRGYIAAALWSSNDESDESGGVPFDKNYSARDIAAKTRAEMEKDAEKFQGRNANLLQEAYSRGYTRARAGHDFWLSRNGHGAGFWDRDELEAGELGDKLTDRADEFGSYNLYIGDDGKIHGSG